MTKDDWFVFEAIAQAVAAVGTLLAVGHSLYLARDARRPHIRLAAYLNNAPTSNGGSAQLLIVRATNFGDFPITLDAFGWLIGWYKPHSLADDVANRWPQPRLPQRIDAGFSLEWVFPADQYAALSPALLVAVKYRHPRWKWLAPPDRVRISAVTSMQYSVSARVSREIIDWMRLSAPLIPPEAFK